MSHLAPIALCLTHHAQSPPAWDPWTLYCAGGDDTHLMMMVIIVPEITDGWFCSPSPWPLAFTINSIHMQILPQNEVKNGENLTLQCIVDVSTTSRIKPLHQVLFYKDDVLLHNVSSMRNTESYLIPHVRVCDSGRYKCTVILNNKEKTTPEYEVWVRGESLEKNTVWEGELRTGAVARRATD